MNRVKRLNNRVRILANDLKFPEGPAFNIDGSLWFVELKDGNLCRWEKGCLDKINIGGAPNGLTFDENGYAWFCDAKNNTINCFDVTKKKYLYKLNKINDGPLANPNDLIFDNNNNLLFTCPGNSRDHPIGYVSCLDNNKMAFKIAHNMFFPNGLIILNDDLIVAETYKQRLWKGKWDFKNRKWLNPKPWLDTGGIIGPDGMCIGLNGLLYVAVYGSGYIQVINNEGIVSIIKLPGKNPTNVTIDPLRKLGLVVTEAEKGMLLSINI